MNVVVELRQSPDLWIAVFDALILRSGGQVYKAAAKEEADSQATVAQIAGKNGPRPASLAPIREYTFTLYG